MKCNNYGVSNRPLCDEDEHLDGADADDVDDGDALESSDEMEDYDDDSSMCTFIHPNLCLCQYLGMLGCNRCMVHP